MREQIEGYIRHYALLHLGANSEAERVYYRILVSQFRRDLELTDKDGTP